MKNALVMARRGENYLSKIFSLLSEYEGKICYVTLNKSAEFILDAAKKDKLELGRFYFIDCLSSIIGIKSKKANIFYESPEQIGKIQKDINKFIDEGCSVVVFDSISDVFSYRTDFNEEKLVSLITSLNARLENKGGVVFVCYENDLANYSIDKIVGLFNRFIKSFSLLGE